MRLRSLPTACPQVTAASPSSAKARGAGGTGRGRKGAVAKGATKPPPLLAAVAEAEVAEGGDTLGSKVRGARFRVGQTVGFVGQYEGFEDRFI